MASISFAGKKIGLFGIQGSGKTFAALKILSGFRAPLIYRITSDFDNLPNAIIFKPTDKYADLDLFLHTAKNWGTNGKIDAVVLDEADLFMTETRLTQGILNEMILLHKHFGDIAVVLISRRPQDIPVKVFGSCHVLLIFATDEPGARSKLSALHSDFEHLLPLLKFEEHNFILKEVSKPPVLYNPLPAA